MLLSTAGLRGFADEKLIFQGQDRANSFQPEPRQGPEARTLTSEVLSKPDLVDLRLDSFAQRLCHEAGCVQVFRTSPGPGSESQRNAIITTMTLL